MSLIKSIKQQLGLSGTPLENYFWDASVPNNLSLKRGTPDAPGADVMQVVDGVLQNSFVSMEAKMATGTTVEFIGIPDWAKRVTFIFASMSTNGVKVPIIQIGSSAGFKTSGYVGSVASLLPDSVGKTAALSVGVNVYPIELTAAAAYTGRLVFDKLGNSNTWVFSGTYAVISATTYANAVVAGNVDAGGTLDRIRFATSTLVDLFDNGAVSVTYE
jgi:hypothetical protein